MEKLKELFEEYSRECEYVQKLRPETLRGYHHAFDIFVKLVPDVSLDTLIPATVTQFFKELDTRDRVVGNAKNNIHKRGIKKTTVATYRSKLNSFFEWLRIKEHIKINPFKEIPYPSVSYEDLKFLSKEKVSKITNAIFSHPDRDPIAHKRDVLMLHILLYCGLRRNELLMLEARDFDLERKVLTVRLETSKSNRTRKIPLHSAIIVYFKDFLAEKNKRRYTTPFIVVSSREDRGLSKEGLKHWVERLKKLSGVRFHLHQFRHTFAMNFLKQSGGNIAKLKQLMGHADIKMTIKYLRCMPTDEMRGDIEKLNIDGLI